MRKNNMRENNKRENNINDIEELRKRFNKSKEKLEKLLEIVEKNRY